MLTISRLEANQTLHSSSKNAVFSTIPSRTRSLLSHIRWMLSRSLFLENSSLQGVLPKLPRFPGSSNTMATTPLIFPYLRSPSYSRNMLSPRSSSSRSSVLDYGCWMNTGTTLCSHSSCSWYSRALLYGNARGH